MNKININIFNILSGLLKRNKEHVKDIWIYGNQSFKNKTDAISDLDLIIVYSKKPTKIKFPKNIKKKITGSVIYIPNNHKKMIFLFEDLKVYSIKQKKLISYKIKSKYLKYRYLTSFLERYYERRKIIYKEFSIFSSNHLSLIKSLIFSYFTFLKYYKKSNLIYSCNKLMKNYKILREKYILKELNKKHFLNYLKKIRAFDKYFFNITHVYLENKFSFLKIEKFNFNFLQKYRLKYSNLNKINDVPKIFCFIYYFYSIQNTKLSRKSRKDIDSNPLFYKFKDKDFLIYLKKKITFLNYVYVDLKKYKFKKGMYRLNNYLV